MVDKLPIQKAREHLDAHKAAKQRLIERVMRYTDDINEDQVNSVLAALWLLKKLKI